MTENIRVFTQNSIRIDSGFGPIYIAGDTDLTKEAKAVKCDIALVPIGGTYTMNPKKAADLINTIRPEIAIPVHYGSIVCKPEDEDEFKKHVMHTIEVVPKISFNRL